MSARNFFSMLAAVMLAAVGTASHAAGRPISSAAPAVSATVYYVRPGGTGDGTSWASAAGNLATLLAAVPSGSEIWVAAGTYKPATDSNTSLSFVLRSGVAVYGGFAGTETLRSQRSVAANVTILSGDLEGDDTGTPSSENTSRWDNSDQVVRASGVDGTAALDGFTINGANSSGAIYANAGSPSLANLTISDNFGSVGGGIFVSSGSPTLSNVTVSGNYADSQGGGIAIIGAAASPTLTNVTISGNSAGVQGGGMYVNSASPTLTGVTISGNYTEIQGGGIFVSSGSPTLSNVTVSGNRADIQGGGMFVSAGAVSLRNVRLSGNSAQTGGGMFMSLGTPSLTNVTVAGNTGGGMYVNSSTMSVRNSIFWANSATQISGSSAPTITYSIVQGGYSGSGNVASDPLFVTAVPTAPSTGGDLRLQSGSPAIDAGDPADTTTTLGVTTDLAGAPRVAGGRVDMGAYEQQPPDTTPPTVTPSVTGTQGSNGWYTGNVSLGWTVTDAESSISSQSGCAAQSVTADTSGVTYTCSATSGGGTGSDSVTIKRDATAPSGSYSLSPLAANGWHKSAVTVSFDATDATSGKASCTADQTLSGEGAGQSASGSCSDNAGNSTSVTASGIDIDLTAPIVTGSRTPAAGAGGWNTAAVTVSFSASDALSGNDGCDGPYTLSGDGAGQSQSGSCADQAGNSASATVSGISIDRTPPAVLITRPANGATYLQGTTVTADYGCTDALSGSGVASCTGPVASGAAIDTSSAGGRSFTVSAADVAGNSASQTVNYTVSAASTSPPLVSATVAGTQGGAGWYRDTVSIRWSVSDPLNPILSTSGCNTTNLRTDTTLAGNTYTCTAVGSGGTRSQSVTVKRDGTVPTVSVTSPLSQATYTRNQVVSASFSCSDALSGLVSCLGSVASGTRLNTSTRGNFTFTVTGTDVAGNTQARVIAYKVQ